MKKYLLTIALLLSTGLFANTASAREREIAVYGTPITDGVAEEVWQECPEYEIGKYITDIHGADGKFRAMWDENYVYVFAEVEDKLISTVAEAEYLQDSVEFFIDENNAKKEYYEKDDAQYRVSAENRISYGDGADEEKFMAAAVKTDKGYNIETAIPLKIIEGREGNIIGFEIQINDDTDGSGNRSSIAKFADQTKISYCNTSQFGELVFVYGDENPFDDVTEYGSIYPLLKKGIINGYEDGTFRSESNVKREEFAAMAARMFDVDGSTVLAFDDVDENEWYYEYIVKTVGADIIKGISDIHFGTGENVNHKDMREIINRILRNNEAEEIAPGTDTEAATRRECADAIYEGYLKLCAKSKQTEKSEETKYCSELISASEMKNAETSNPVMTQRFGADPFAMEYNGRIYLYMSGDKYRYGDNGEIVDNDYSNVATVSVISSADMVNWTDHGEIAVAGKTIDGGAAAWAKNSWAPCVAHKTIDGKEKFFLYFGNGTSSIGVLVSDSPTGPFHDPLDAPLISRNTMGTEDVVWIFDPAVLVDDDGTGYLYFGGGLPGTGNVEETESPKTMRVIRLGDDMISTEGDAVKIDAPASFEDSGIHKYNGEYYYSYCTNFVGEHDGGKYGYGVIAYMTSDNPMGPFEYRGEMLDNMYNFFETGGNNHHAVFDFKDKHYIAYHTQTIGKFLGDIKGYRNSHINEVEYNDDGTIRPVKADYAGVNPVGNLNPYERVEAETIAYMSGTSTMKCETDGNMQLCDINNGDRITVKNVDFAYGAENFYAYIKAENGGKIEIHLDNENGKVIGEVEIPVGDGEYKLYETISNNVYGVHDICFIFKGEADKELFKWDYWKVS